MEMPEEEITVVPTNDLLIFGDGMIAMSLGAVEGKDEQGRDIIDFILEPSQLLRKRFRIKDSDLNRFGRIRWRGLKSHIRHLNKYDPARRVIFYLLNFIHQRTEISEFYQELLDTLERDRRIIARKDGEIMYLTEQLELAKSRPYEFVGQNIELHKKVAESIRPDDRQENKNE